MPSCNRARRPFRGYPGLNSICRRTASLSLSSSTFPTGTTHTRLYTTAHTHTHKNLPAPIQRAASGCTLGSLSKLAVVWIKNACKLFGKCRRRYVAEECWPRRIEDFTLVDVGACVCVFVCMFYICAMCLCGLRVVGKQEAGRSEGGERDWLACILPTQAPILGCLRRICAERSASWHRVSVAVIVVVVRTRVVLFMCMHEQHRIYV